MKKILLFGTAILVATNVLAFGGGGKSRKAIISHNTGVDSIGVHINGDKNSAVEKCAEGVEKDQFGHCNICTNGGIYLSYMDVPCTDKIDTIDCANNADCEAGEYCSLRYGPPSSSILGSIATYTWQGYCAPVGDVISYTYKGTTMIRSTDTMNWWAAENWCRYHGKSIVTLADFGIDESTLYSAGHNGYCFSKSTDWKCNNVDWDSIQEAFPDLWVEGAFWVSDDLTRNRIESASLIRPSNLAIGGTPYRFSTGGYALCK